MSKSSIMLGPEQIKAILKGNRSQFIIPFLPSLPIKSCGQILELGDPDIPSKQVRFETTDKMWTYKKPYLVDDVIFVLERWENINKPNVKPEYVYEVDAIMSEDYCPEECDWQPAAKMPADAIRLFLKVTNIQFARFLDLTPRDRVNSIFAVIGDFGYQKSISKENLIKAWPELVDEENPMLWIVEFELIYKVEELKAQYSFTKETRITESEDGVEVFLIEGSSGKTILNGDCYHDKINVLIDGFLRGLAFAGISYSVKERIVKK